MGGEFASEGNDRDRRISTDNPTLCAEQVSSGTLLITVDAHYRSVSALAFSDDGACLVTGSEDAGVSVWSIGR